jgi:hypothetical protein
MIKGPKANEYFVSRIENLSKQIDQTKKAESIITPETHYRVRQTIENWLSAIQLAESKYRPQRMFLLDIYRTALLDSHIHSMIENRKNKAVLQDFMLVKNDQKMDVEIEWFKNSWFYKFISLALDSKFWGYSVIQFDDMIDNVFTDVSLVDPYKIIPEKKEIKRSKYDVSGTSVSEFDCLFVGSKDDLGLLHKVSQYYLYKKEVLASYNEYIEVFGQPTRIAKVGPNSNQKQVYDMLLNMGSNAFGVFDHQTELEFLSNNDTGNDIFEKLLNYLDEQINITISGASEGEKNYAQANKDEMTQHTQSKIDNMFLEGVINNQLIPYMVDFGLTSLEGSKFKFVNEEKLSLKEKFEFDSKLLEFYDLDPTYLEDTYDTKIIGRNTETEPTNTTDEIYNKYFK